MSREEHLWFKSSTEDAFYVKSSWKKKMCAVLQ